jgi:hypothetical protein
MRLSLLLPVAGGAALIAGSALAAPDYPSQPPSTSSPSAPSADSSAPPSAKTGAAADTSATTGGFTVGMPVKDKTGTTIGSIANLTTDSSGMPAAVIKMGTDQFQVETAKLNLSKGAAVINLSQSDLTKLLHNGSSSAAPNPDSSGGPSKP